MKNGFSPSQQSMEFKTAKGDLGVPVESCEMLLESEEDISLKPTSFRMYESRKKGPQ